MAFSLVQRSTKYQSPGLGAVTQTYSAGLANFGTGNRLLVSPFAHYSSVGSEQITSVAYNTSDAATERVERQNPVNVNNQFTIFDRLSVATGGAHDTSLTFAQAGAPDGHYPTGNTSEWSYSGTCTSAGTNVSDGNDNAPTISIAVQAGDLVIGGFVLADSANFTVTSSPAGATVEWSEGTVTSFEGGEAVSIIAASTGTLTLTWGMSVSQRWSAAIAVYRDSGSGGPTIDTQPSDAHVHVGATATFTASATASGGGTLSYQWKKNGVNVSGGSGGTSASYTTPPLTAADDQASYTWDVTETGGSNDGTTTSSAATLRVGVIHIASGTIAYSASGGTSVAPGYPAGVAAGDLLVMVLGQKPSSANGGTATTPSSPWALDGSLTGANDGNTGGYTTTLGADTGNTNIYTYSAVATGSESGTLSVTVGTNNVCWAQMLLFRAPSSATWSVAATTGKDTSAGNLSITGAADPGVAAGDYVIAGVVIPTDVTTPSQFSAEAFSQTGVGFGTVVEFSEPDSTTGNDIGGVLFGAPVSTGPSSAAPTFTATAGGTTTNVRGPGVFVRLRATTSGVTVLNGVGVGLGAVAACAVAAATQGAAGVGVAQSAAVAPCTARQSAVGVGAASAAAVGAGLTVAYGEWFGWANSVAIGTSSTVAPGVGVGVAAARATCLGAGAAVQAAPGVSVVAAATVASGSSVATSDGVAVGALCGVAIARNVEARAGVGLVVGSAIGSPIAVCSGVGVSHCSAAAVGAAMAVQGADGVAVGSAACIGAGASAQQAAGVSVHFAVGAAIARMVEQQAGVVAAAAAGVGSTQAQSIAQADGVGVTAASAIGSGGAIQQAPGIGAVGAVEISVALMLEQQTGVVASGMSGLAPGSGVALAAGPGVGVAGFAAVAVPQSVSSGQGVGVFRGATVAVGNAVSMGNGVGTGISSGYLTAIAVGRALQVVDGVAAVRLVAVSGWPSVVFVLTGPRDTISFRPETDTIHFARRGLDTMRFR